ncbi:murein hydrolase activator EnvC family protein [Agromyces soli]|uniref:M23 family metallopeptidase n=2 Tax=Agromyces soli TaxID=659012 RepID=A0ABY4AQV3_9MICO|nr:M23 family metallopeptidase [Agromyces soli]UOE25234.1 M23 family metallopeptidase [Agromyces soli]
MTGALTSAQAAEVRAAPQAVPGAPVAPLAAGRSADTDWWWPVGPPATITAPFRAPPTPYAAGHRGIDLAAAAGDEVRAPAGGTVSFAGTVAGRPLVAVDHGDGYVSAVEPVAALVAVGTAVAPGEPLGTVAAGGHCDGACIHFGVRLHGEYVSPMLLLGSVPRAVLLPLD